MRFTLFTFVCALLLLAQSCVTKNSTNTTTTTNTDTLPDNKPEFLHADLDNLEQMDSAGLLIQRTIISDTNLREQRQLTLHSKDLDAWRVLLKLIPGKLYAFRVDKTYPKSGTDTIISWKSIGLPYDPASDTLSFSDPSGIATQLMNKFDYSDNKGNAFKIITFQHQSLDDLEAHSHTTRLAMGIAKFTRIADSWQMKTFQPCVYMGVSTDLTSNLIAIGEDQFALVVNNYLGGSSGRAYQNEMSLFVGINGLYKVVLNIPEYNLQPLNGSSHWESSLNTDDKNGKKRFKDIIVTTKGSFGDYDPDDEDEPCPKEILPYIKGKSSLNYSIKKRYTYNGTKYVINGAPEIEVRNIKDSNNK